MQKLVTSDKIYIADSGIKNAGRGVFAQINIQKGELIEACPVIEIPEHDTENLTEGILITYLYYFGEMKERAVVALGFGSIYNHTDTPNARYEEKPTEQMITFIATKDIRKDEEITVDYNQHDTTRKIPLWFSE